MNVETFVREQTTRRFIKMGYSDRDAKDVGERAVEVAGNGITATAAIEKAIQAGKKMYRKKR